MILSSSFGSPLAGYASSLEHCFPQAGQADRSNARLQATSSVPEMRATMPMLSSVAARRLRGISRVQSRTIPQSTVRVMVIFRPDGYFDSAKAPVSWVQAMLWLQWHADVETGMNWPLRRSKGIPAEWQRQLAGLSLSRPKPSQRQRWEAQGKRAKACPPGMDKEP